MPSPGPALTFDPRYVIAAIDTWRAGDLAPIAPPDLERETARLMRERFIAWNIIGMHKQTVLAPAVTKAIGVFTALKVATKTTKGKGEARVTMRTTTAEGREILTEEPIGGALYPRFAECLSSASTDISGLLDLLAVHGPLTQPVLHLIPGAPRRGAVYQTAIKEGLLEYQRQATTTIITTPHIAYEPASPRATPVQRIKVAQSWAMHAHSAGALSQLDKGSPSASPLASSGWMLPRSAKLSAQRALVSPAPGRPKAIARIYSAGPVTAARSSVSDQAGARKLLAGLAPLVPRLKKIWADAAYRGKELAEWCKQQGNGWDLDVVEREPGIQGFQVQSRR